MLQSVDKFCLKMRESMDKRSTLHGFASTMTLGAVAAAGLPAGDAAAQDAGSMLDGMNVIVEGGLVFSDFTENLYDEKGGSVPGLNADGDNGFYGSVAVSKGFADNWDWRLSISTVGLSDNESRISSGKVPLTLTSSLNMLTTDIGVGRNYTFGTTGVRFGIGLLATDVTQDKGIAFSGFGDDLELGYTGYGAKLSADIVHPLSEDGRLTMIGGLSLAPTSGDFETKINGRSVEEGSGSALLTSGYIGMEMQQTETMTLRGGLRIDDFDGDPDGTDAGFGILGGDATTTTAFVGMKIQF